MPIYEYRCEQCGEFEVMQKITGRPLAKCPTCRSKVTKLISNTSFQLKGTGWYATDYAHKGNGGETATQSKSETKSETKTESKASSDSSSTKDSKPNPTAAAA